MASPTRTLKLTFLGDVSDLAKKVDVGSKEVESFGSKIKGFAKKAAVAFAAAGVAAAAFAVKFGKDAIVAGEAAATANARINQINESMGLFGDSTKMVSDRLISLAETTARNTGVDTNSIKLTQAKLLTFKELAATAGELGGQFDRATKAAIDMAAAGFGEASMNAVQLGKALNDPIKGITALNRSGITFTETEKARIAVLVESNQVGEAQKMILEAIETQVGGTAEATANATDRMRVGWQQVQERIGMKLLPVLDQLTSFLFNRIFPVFDKFTAQLGSGEGLGGAFTNLVNTIKKIFLPIWDGLISAFNRIKTAIGDNFSAFKTFGSYISTYLAPILGKVLGGALRGLGVIAQGVITIIGKVVGVINKTVELAIKGINALIKAYNAIPFLPDIPTITAPSPTVSGASRGSIRAIEAGVSSAAPATTQPVAPVTNNITVNGAIDSESTARQIAKVLTESASRGTGGGGGFIGGLLVT